jgi:hypothetical protein
MTTAMTDERLAEIKQLINRYPLHPVSHELWAEVTRLRASGSPIYEAVQAAFLSAEALANGLVQDSDSGDHGRTLDPHARAACRLVAQLAHLRTLCRPDDNRRPFP